MRISAWPVWAGVVPLVTSPGVPVPDGPMLPGVTAFDGARLGRRYLQSPAATNPAQ